MPYIITERYVSQCCGKPAISELDISEHGASGRCSGCLEGAMFEPEPGEDDWKEALGAHKANVAAWMGDPAVREALSEAGADLQVMDGFLRTDPPDNTCAECGRTLSDGEADKCSQCSYIAYTGGV